MNILESLNSEMIGLVEVEVIDESTGEVVSSNKQNLIVDYSKQIIRNLISGINSSPLKTLQIGDMNMSFGDDLTNLPPAQPSDTALVHMTYHTNFITREFITVDSRPAVKFTYYIDKNQANSSDPAVYSTLITEAGLVNTIGELFARITLPIIKTRDSGVRLSWTIVI